MSNQLNLSLASTKGGIEEDGKKSQREREREEEIRKGRRYGSGVKRKGRLKVGNGRNRCLAVLDVNRESKKKG